MEPLQVLERYYNNFINSDDPKMFFIGMTDYLDYGDNVPEFDLITTQISNMPKALMSQYEEQEKKARKKIEQAHKEVSAYVAKNKVESPALQEALHEYGDFLEKRAFSSSPLATSLHIALGDAIEALHAMPDHKEFASKYVEYHHRDKTLVNRYLPLQEFNDFVDTKDELDRGAKDALWGAQMRMYELCDVVRKGRETHKKIVERYKKREQGASFDLLNYGVLIGEWVKTEEGRIDRKPTFFSVEKIRPKAQRFHTYVVAHFAEAHDAIGQHSQKADQKVQFDENACRLYINGTELRIRRVSDQYDLLRVVFSNPEEAGKEWFFSEISELVDPALPQERTKKYYNAAYQIKKNLASQGISDFFITTAHSVQINKNYLS